MTSILFWISGFGILNAKGTLTEVIKSLITTDP